MKVGALYLGDARCQFTVWAPLKQQVSVKILSPHERILPMQQIGQGYWQTIVDAIEPGARYVYQLDNELERPDPASQFQPDGVHAASQLVDHTRFTWSDQGWQGVPLEELIIYEVHIGTFTPEGTFESVIPRLERLKTLGITAIEIMPVAQVPGDRNWGYDGVYPYAVQNSYGGPDGLKQLVNACHQHGISVVFDAVYNHLGPEGNYLGAFAPYFTDKYRPIWGDAINYDDAYCDGVRNYFLENALYWFETFHIDALRLDAIQGIYDFSVKHFLEELAERVAELSERLGRKLYLTAESDLNDVRVIRPQAQGGYGIDSQWCDDFHHALHALITGEHHDYYQDFGSIADLEKSFREGFVYSGQYSPHRKRRQGNSSAAEPARQFVVCSQNHDQTGNRILGERMTHLTSFEGLKLTAGAVLLSPFIPLLFMGEEYGETARFFYFISHSDQALVEAVRKSKDEEFKQAGATEESYDPQAVEAFQQCKLNWGAQFEGKHQVLWQFYQQLIQMRRTHPVLKTLDKTGLTASSDEAKKLLFLHRRSSESQVFYIMNFGDRSTSFSAPLPAGSWSKLLDSADEKWMGPGAELPEKLLPDESYTIPAKSIALYH